MYRVRSASPNIDGIPTVIARPEYATGCGLIQYAFKSMEAGEGKLPIGKWLKGLFLR